jgi:acyl carrier protein
MEEQKITPAIRGFMTRSFEGRVVQDDEDIFAAGFANSLFAMQLVAFVEREFGIELESEDLEMENFRSVHAIATLVGRKAAAAS